jgi:choline dehydrogenase-like flavoprotein
MSNPASDLKQPDDVLIVGGGSAGATLAARLSEDPSRRVLLLEAGPAFTSDEMPAELINAEHVAAPTFDWGYTAREGASTAEMAVPRGRVLGGSSAVNAAVAIRADAKTWNHGKSTASRGGRGTRSSKRLKHWRTRTLATTPTMVALARSQFGSASTTSSHQACGDSSTLPWPTAISTSTTSTGLIPKVPAAARSISSMAYGRAQRSLSD